MAYQGRGYALNVENATLVASATLPVVTLIGAATIRPMIYSLEIGSATTPANNAVGFQIQRCTAAGTAGSALTPQALDPADPAATSTSGLAVFSVGPTLTANAFEKSIALNQQATYVWQAPPGGEIKVPATAANGLALMCQVLTSSFSTSATIYFAE